MKDKIYFEKGEFFGLRNYPDDPDFAKLKKDHVYKDYKFYSGFKDSDIQKQHEDEVQACIAAKKRIENPELLNLTERIVGGITYYYRGGMSVPLKDGDIFDLPEGLMFEEINCCASDICDTNGQCEHCREPLTNLRLVPKQFNRHEVFKVDEEIPSKQEVKEESQEELYEAFIKELGSADIRQHHAQVALKSKFTIKRNK